VKHVHAYFLPQVNANICFVKANVLMEQAVHCDGKKLKKFKLQSTRKFFSSLDSAVEREIVSYRTQSAVHKESPFFSHKFFLIVGGGA
jgi:hypothetical protein